MNFDAFWKWLCEGKRTMVTLGGRSEFTITANGDGGSIWSSTEWIHRFTIDDARATWDRFHALPEAERLKAGRYTDEHWSDCPDRNYGPWLAAAIYDFIDQMLDE